LEAELAECRSGINFMAGFQVSTEGVNYFRRGVDRSAAPIVPRLALRLVENCCWR
jgi:hypothetical protein